MIDIFTPPTPLTSDTLRQLNDTEHSNSYELEHNTTNESNYIDMNQDTLQVLGTPPDPPNYQLQEENYQYDYQQVPRMTTEQYLQALIENEAEEENQLYNEQESKNEIQETSPQFGLFLPLNSNRTNENEQYHAEYPRRRDSHPRHQSIERPGNRLVYQLSALANGRNRPRSISSASASTTYVKAMSRESARELAKAAKNKRATSVADVSFENPNYMLPQSTSVGAPSSVRESVRRVQAYSRREVPLKDDITLLVKYRRKVCWLTVDQESITWILKPKEKKMKKKKPSRKQRESTDTDGTAGSREMMQQNMVAKVIGVIDMDDVVGARALLESNGTVFQVHYFQRGRGHGASALKRKHRVAEFKIIEQQQEARRPHLSSVDDENKEVELSKAMSSVKSAVGEVGKLSEVDGLVEPGHMQVERVVEAIQEIVRWQARAPPVAIKRKIKIIINPHSGKRRGRHIWFEQVKQFFDMGNFDYCLEETTYGGHGIAMGKEFSAEDGYEALVFIGGDGTLCEFMNGLLTRPEHEWREIVAQTPISLISAGTQNAFGYGVGIPTMEAAVYCILKRKMRPLDVICAIADHEPEKIHYSYCGLGWGVAGDIAQESERYRWMGTFRYTFLKLKRTVFKPKKHTGEIKYIPTDPQPNPLRVYDDIKDEGALDQFEIEEGNVYDEIEASNHIAPYLHHRPSWHGTSDAIKSPASSKRYPDESIWKEESGEYVVVGVVNSSPDAVYAHPSDGNMDLIITRKGKWYQNLQLGLLYLVGKELSSPLISYLKVKAAIIKEDQVEDCCNLDGEVLPGPGPWRMEIVPSLFKALSEK